MKIAAGCLPSLPASALKSSISTPAFPDLPAARASENARYFYSFPAHYTPEGYRVAGKAILSALENQR